MIQHCSMTSSVQRITGSMLGSVVSLVLILSVLEAVTFIRILPTSTAFVPVDTAPKRRHMTIVALATTTATPTEFTDTVSDDSMAERKHLDIVPPNQGFRTTKESEVSIASMNLLAPFYNSLQLPQKTTTDYERWAFLDKDRTERVPVAIRMAKQTNADVLCLQEIEGGKLGENGAAEGREFTLRDDIREWLAESTVAEDNNGNKMVLEGYDSFVWSALNPNNKRGDVVGLCIAWRSQKHSLVDWEGYRRGMVCRLKENTENEASFAIANLHLPARPSNVMGRLSTMSRTIRKLSDLDAKIRKDRSSSTSLGIDGLLVVAGDFNSDEHSVAARLLTHGYTNYGNVRDRNYKAKITKASATDMSHPYRFMDSYNHGEDSSNHKDPRFKDGGFRDRYASITVSLQGRGPGIMDHLFYATGTRKGKLDFPPKLTNVRKNPSQVATQSAGVSTVETLSESLIQQHLGGKRSKRRKKGESRGGGPGSDGMAYAARYVEDPNARITIDSLLATVQWDDEERLQIIRDGLPNLEAGFPSDHLPVGALFSAVSKSNNNSEHGNKVNEMDNEKAEKVSEMVPEPTKIDEPVETEVAAASESTNAVEDEPQTANTSRTTSSGVSSTVQRRRKTAQKSFGLRRRHNVVLNSMTEWLVGRGATSTVLDKPLYKNDLLMRILGPEQHQKLKKKSRAPDLVSVVVNSSADQECLVVIEVAVASDPEKVRATKQSKYQDLVDILSSSSSSSTCCFAAIVVGDDGMIPEGTRDDIESLAKWTQQASQSDSVEEETDRLCTHLQSVVSSFRVPS